MGATLQRIDRDDVVILKPAGRMTIDASGQEELLKSAVDRALAEGKRRFVIDGADVTYIDSAGIGEMARAYTRVLGNGGRLVFAVPEGHNIRNRFHLTKLDQELTSYATVDEAIRAVQGPSAVV
jgi:anti-anti-sigma factor